MRKKLVIVGLILFVLTCLITLAFSAKKEKSTVLGEKVAVVYVDGVITNSSSRGLWGDVGGSESIINQLHKASEDSSVKAIVLRINSPGGSTGATQEVGEEIKKIRANGKLIYTSMGDVTASGGYWLASCTDKIYANSSTITGSIGVYMPYSNWEELYRKIGIKQEKIKSGEFKDIMSADRPMTNKEREIIQGIVNDTYEGFVQTVAEGRKMDINTVRALADGRIYTGNQAKAVGLVDDLGNMYDAIDAVAKAANIKGKPVVKEFGNDNPFAKLTGSSSKVELFNILLMLLKNEDTTNMGLLAPQEKW